LIKSIFRRLRGALGTGLTWAAGWGVLGAVHGLVLGIFKPWQWEFYNPILTTARGYAIAGLIAGTGFGALLMALDRGKTLGALSYRRFGAWGAAGGALVPVLVHLTRGLTSSSGWGDVAATALVTAILGGLSAVGTLRVVRNGLLPDSAEESPDELESGQKRLLPEPKGETV
jgi:hypothetical protein